MAGDGKSEYVYGGEGGVAGEVARNTIISKQDNGASLKSSRQSWLKKLNLLLP